MIYPEIVHPWTVTWFESLPQAYQYLDAQQKNPASQPWDGLTPLPFDLTENGGWTIQYSDADRQSIMQDFESAPGEKVHYQVWVDPARIPGGSVYVDVFRRGSDQPLPSYGESSFEGVVEPGVIEGWFYPPVDGQYTIVLTVVSAPVIAPVTNVPSDPTIVQLTTGEISSVVVDPVDSTAVLLSSDSGHGIEGDPDDLSIVVLTTPYPIFEPGSYPVLDAVSVSLREVNYSELPNPDNANEETFYPLLRFMDGVGQIGGQYREISDHLWDGIYTNPETCPDSALRWLAQMMGIHKNVYGRLEPDILRDLLRRTASDGLTAIGSRSSLQEVFKSFLTGEQTCNVVPHPTESHTIRVRVSLAEVPNLDLAALGEKLRDSGTVPAGHVIQVVEGNPTWDQWEAAAGGTWNEYESRVSTWSENDTLGVTF